MIEPVIRGAGPAVLFIHGSAADHTTWSIQLASLAGEIRAIAYDRRAEVTRVADHVADAAAILEVHAGGAAVVCGSSFGGVIALELCRRRPELVRAAILCEPPLASSDSAPAVPGGFGCHFDALVATRGGEAAAEFFLRTVLTDEVFERIPRRWQARATAQWRQIRADSLALAGYRVGYDRLGAEIAAPVRLLGGERSPRFYRATLEALAVALPGGRLDILAGAGHMMHSDAHRAFNAVVTELARASATGG